MQLIKEIAIILIFGRTLTAWMGILTLLGFMFAASIGYASFHGKKFLPFKWHPRVVVVAFILAIIHAILAFSLYF